MTSVPVKLSCAICLNQHRHTPAVTLIHGYAVCTSHIDLVSQPEFDIITLRSKRPVQSLIDDIELPL